ncbi:MAG: hypothetical protein PHT28_05270 [Dehalococcoidales bacterium]|nr:hypothetical protein [Dehalococcoidales bacterium]
MSFSSASEESHTDCARSYGNSAHVTTSTIAGKILRRAFALLKDDSVGMSFRAPAKNLTRIVPVHTETRQRNQEDYYGEDPSAVNCLWMT